jgi:hypothetical protein
MLACMSMTSNVRDLLEGHVTLELESIDRLYLNGYVPQLQHGAGLVGFLCQQRGQPIASPALLGHITGKFVAEATSILISNNTSKKVVDCAPKALSTIRAISGSTRGLKTCPTSKTLAARLTGACWKSSVSAKTVA